MKPNAPHYYYQERIRDELAQRIEKNPRFSLRAFADQLGVGASVLSLILSGRRPISTRLVERIFSSLEFSEGKKRNFLESVLKEKSDLGLKRVSPKLKQHVIDSRERKNGRSAINIGLDEFRIISDWYHYAILELTSIKGFKADFKWVSKSLEISEIEAKLAIERLFKLELLESRDGRWRKTNLSSDTKDKSKTSAFHKKRQRQMLLKSIESLENDPIELRNHSGITVAIDSKKLLEAKKRIGKFMWDLANELTTGEKDGVYEMQFSLFPLHKQ